MYSKGTSGNVLLSILFLAPQGNGNVPVTDPFSVTPGC